MTFLARYHGGCAGCDEHIDPGDIVEYVGEQLVHEGCHPDGRPDPIDFSTADVCPECWMVRSVSGGCSCEPAEPRR